MPISRAILVFGTAIAPPLFFASLIRYAATFPSVVFSEKALTFLLRKDTLPARKDMKFIAITGFERIRLIISSPSMKSILDGFVALTEVGNSASGLNSESIPKEAPTL